ncbi:MAG: hypothetical protein ABJL99_08615 [Aliishimia sp.]
MASNDSFFWDGYLHWARVLEKSDPDVNGARPDGSMSDLYEPVFVRIPIGTTTLDLLEQTLQGLEDYYTKSDTHPANFATQLEFFSATDILSFLADWRFDPNELLIGFEHAIEYFKKHTKLKMPEFFAYRPVAYMQGQHKAALYEVLDIGVPAFVRTTKKAFSISTKPFLPAPVVTAIIDNDIGFLNRRFRKSDGESTRFAAIWLQARETKSSYPTTAYQDIHIGDILQSEDIETRIKTYRHDERRAYEELNARLHQRPNFKLAPPIESHGTMAADLAFGHDDYADPDADPALLDDVPIFGVQLPPEAATDTSGTTSENYIVQAVRWICFQARQSFANVPVVINISYGVLAGQKDGEKFIEAQIAKEVELADQLYGQSVSVVFAYGNGKNTRQLATLDIDKNSFKTLEWRVPPNNPSPSFVEIRTIANDTVMDISDKLRISLVDPNGVTVAQGPAKTGTETAWPDIDPSTDDVTSARLYNVPRRAFWPGLLKMVNPAYSMLAIAPTTSTKHHLNLAKPGIWTLKLENTDTTADMSLVLQIQRGDTAPGLRSGGRQSRFEGPLVPVLDHDLASVTVQTPLTNDGTNSAFSNARYVDASGQDLIYAVGADRLVFGHQVPAPYSAQGADWTGKSTPDTTQIVDKLFTFGRLTTGTYSGTKARLSGTSAAAALQSRALMLAKIQTSTPPP